MSEGTRIAIWGQSGSGKSTLMDKMIRFHNRVIVFDRLPTRQKFATKYGFQKITDLGFFDRWVRNNYEHGFRIWFQPQLGHDLEAFNKVADILLQIQERCINARFKPRHIALAIDEMKKVLPNHKAKADQNKGELLCTEGRHFNISVIGATQRPAQVSTEFRGNLDAMYFFQLQDHTDQDAVYRITGDKALTEKIANLPKYHFYEYQDRRATLGQTEPI